MSRPVSSRERCGIILHPAGHTLSPLLHAEAYRELGLDARYEVFDTPAAAFESRVGELRRAGLRQLSVSLPHKEAALALSDHASQAARRIGAANTLTFTDEGVRADNTDWIGFRLALEQLEPGRDWHTRSASVLGAGGAARGVVYALRELGCRVRIVARNRPRAERLAADLGAELGTIAGPYELLVNTTPLGMHPHTEASAVVPDQLRPGALIFDTIYRPAETRLLREARERGCRTENGLGMLVHQAVEQVELWSGRRPSAARLRAAALAALDGR